MDKPPATVDDLPRYRDRIKGWVIGFGVPSADAEDVTQEVLAAAVRYFSTYDPEKGTFVGWLKRIARNEAWQYLKKKGVSPPPELLAEPEVFSETPEGRAFDSEMERALLRVLDNLDVAERNLLVMRFAEGLSTGEISTRLAIPEATVKSRLSRTLERCREGFEELGVKDSPGSLLVPLLFASASEKREGGGSGGHGSLFGGQGSPPQKPPILRHILESRWTAFAAGGALVYLLFQWQHRSDLLTCGVWPRMMPLTLECGGNLGSSEPRQSGPVEPLRSAPPAMMAAPQKQASKPTMSQPEAEPFTDFTAAEGVGPAVQRDPVYEARDHEGVIEFATGEVGKRPTNRSRP